MSDILIFKCNNKLEPSNMTKLHKTLVDQMNDGLILLPPCVDILVVPDDLIIKDGEEKTNEL